MSRHICEAVMFVALVVGLVYCQREHTVSDCLKTRPVQECR